MPRKTASFVVVMTLVALGRRAFAENTDEAATDCTLPGVGKVM
jgi:hypothetical protein